MTQEQADDILDDYMSDDRKQTLLNQAWMLGRYINVFNSGYGHVDMPDVRQRAAKFVAHEAGYRGPDFIEVAEALYQRLKNWSFG